MIRVIVALIALTASVSADPDPDAADRAKAHFKQAKAYEAAGQFARAADEFNAAYELDPRPEMLFNIGQAFRLAGAKREALDYFNRYIDEQPDGAGAAEARQHIATLTKEIGEADLKAHVPATGNAPDLPEPGGGKPVSSPIAPPPPTDRIERPGGSSLRIAGLATAGAGILAIGLGVKFGFDARGTSDELTRHSGAWTDADRILYADGQVADRNMVISYIVGSGLVAAGGVLYWVGSRSVHVSAVATSRAASAMLVGTF